MKQSCLFCDDVESDATLIKEYELWTVYANYTQLTIGSVVIVLNRHEEQVSGVTIEEDIERHNITKDLETAIRSVWKHDYANNFMLANKVRHIHYHFVPRYSDKREFAGRTWVDENFGSMPNIKESRKSQKVLDSIIEELQKNLS